MQGADHTVSRPSPIPVAARHMASMLGLSEMLDTAEEQVRATLAVPLQTARTGSPEAGSGSLTLSHGGRSVYHVEYDLPAGRFLIQILKSKTKPRSLVWFLKYLGNAKGHMLGALASEHNERERLLGRRAVDPLVSKIDRVRVDYEVDSDGTRLTVVSFELEFHDSQAKVPRETVEAWLRDNWTKVAVRLPVHPRAGHFPPRELEADDILMITLGWGGAQVVYERAIS